MVEIFADVREDGTLSTGKRSEAYQAIKSFAGKRIRIKIERAFNKRSNSQNAYYWGVIVPILKEALIQIGYNEARNSEWVHDFVKVNFLLDEKPDKDGVVRKVVRRTSGLSTSEFMDLISDLQQWAAENLGVVIPDPNEQINMFS